MTSETDDDDVQIGGQMVGQGPRSDFLLGHAVESVVLPPLFVLFGFRVLPFGAVGVVRARKQVHRLDGALAVPATRNVHQLPVKMHVATVQRVM